MKSNHNWLPWLIAGAVFVATYHALPTVKESKKKALQSIQNASLETTHVNGDGIPDIRATTSYKDIVIFYGQPDGSYKTLEQMIFDAKMQIWDEKQKKMEKIEQKYGSKAIYKMENKMEESYEKETNNLEKETSHSETNAIKSIRQKYKQTN